MPTYARHHTNGVSCRQLVYLAGNTSILVTESHKKVVMDLSTENERIYYVNQC